MDTNTQQKMMADLEAYRARKAQQPPAELQSVDAQVNQPDIRGDLEKYRASKQTSVSSSAPQAPSKVSEPLINRFTDFIGGKGVTDFLGSQIARASIADERVRKEVQVPKARDVLGSAAQLASFAVPFGAPARAASLGLKAAGFGAKALAAGKGIQLAKNAGEVSKGVKTAGELLSGALGGAAGEVGGIIQGGEDYHPGLSTGIGLAAGALPGIGGLASRAVKGAIPGAREALEASGKILQGDTKAQQVGLRALTKIDTTGVKTYEDLSNVINKNVEEKLAVVENEFKGATEPIKLPKLTQTVEVEAPNGKVLRAKTNYVSQALTQLGQLYRKTRSLPESLRIKALTQKAKKEGLTPLEINELAKEYGREFKAKGFNKLGQPLTSVNDQAFENTRKGLKGTARGFLKSDAAKEADKVTSDLLNTKKMVDKMRESVNKLSQRVEKRGLVQKAFRGLANVLDVATLGGPKEFVTKLFFPSNVGLKVHNALDLEEQLSKNLKLLERLGKAPDGEVEAALRKLLGRGQK
jgi:hypothetical protein